MTKATADVPLREITAVIAELKDTALYTWKRQAQQAGIVGWRDSTVFPGALARFEMTAYTAGSYRFAYRYGKRRYSAQAQSADQRPFVSSGSFRESIANRKPVSKNSRGGYQGGDVVTVISIGGGPLNAMGDKRGYVASRRSSHQRVVHQPDYIRRRGDRTWRVRGSDQRRTVQVTSFTPAPMTYREEFEIRQADLRDMEARAERAYRDIVRSAVFSKSGKLKVSVLSKFKGVEAAA